VDWLREAIHFEAYTPNGLPQPKPQPQLPQAQPQPHAQPQSQPQAQPQPQPQALAALNLPRLTGLVQVPPSAQGSPRAAAEQFNAMCAAAEGTRNDALHAWPQGGRTPDDAALMRYNAGLLALQQQCQQLLVRLQPAPAAPAVPAAPAALAAPAASVAAPSPMEIIVLD
jgi:hypothetical protein